MVAVDVLKTFVAIIDCGSIVGAARTKGYSPAAVSRLMRGRQRGLGVTFFERHGRTIRVNPEASDYAAEARESLDEVHNFERFCEMFARPVAESLAHRDVDTTTARSR